VITLFGILAIIVGAFLLLRRLERGQLRSWLATRGLSVWVGLGLAAALAGLLIAASAGRLLLILLPVLAALPLLFRQRTQTSDATPGEVVETGWFRAFKPSPVAPLDAVVRRGAMEGRRLSELGLADLVWLHQQIDDEDSLVLLERFLTREFPGWRERVDRAAAELMNDGMTAAKAREILGLGPEAGPDDIIEAHRRLMQRLHPDRGGSGYLASLLNCAKSVLLERR
jgi:hypothetical protein